MTLDEIRRPGKGVLGVCSRQFSCLEFLPRFVGWESGAAGPCCAQQKGHPTVVLFNSLHNWACRDGAFNKTSLEDGAVEVVIVLSDSTNETEDGGTRESARYCQCGAQRRTTRTDPEAILKRAQQVLVHVHAHVCRTRAVRVMFFETGSN